MAGIVHCRQGAVITSVLLIQFNAIAAIAGVSSLVCMSASAACTIGMMSKVLTVEGRSCNVLSRSRPVPTSKMTAA